MWSALRSPFSALLFSLTMIGLCLNTAIAQVPHSNFPGQVFDPSHATISNAKVTIVAVGASSGQSTATDRNGQFSFSVEPGRYVVTIVAKGFSDFTQSIETSLSMESRDFVLALAVDRRSVTVTDSGSQGVSEIVSATKTPTPLLDIPQSIAVVTQKQIHEQAMQSIGDIVRYVPGVTAIQGENNRDQLVIRGNSTSADFFVNGTRDDVQYYRDTYNLERMEILKGPNAMIFGRGGGGGVINRVTKEAGFAPSRELTLWGGAFGNKRISGDFNQPINGRFAIRLNGVAEDSGSFRDNVGLKRFGVNPTLTYAPGNHTTLLFSYEYLRDIRRSDRGIPSFQGLPAEMNIGTFFGNPAYNDVWAYVNLASATVQHRTGRMTFRDHTSFGNYDRGYQNFVPGAVNSAKTSVAVTGYNNATKRRNLIHQTDMTYMASTGRIQHTLLAGAEIGLQFTDNFRNTGFFDNSATSISVPYANPVIHNPVTFRQNATDADNHLFTNVNAVYAQDQVELARHVQVITGLRFDHFDLKYHNNRTNENLRRIDNLVSPRAGIVYKPVAQVSIYGSYGISHLPSSGDQFSSLTTITQQVQPEKFNSYESGLKWDLLRGLSLSTAVFRLDRINTRATDPNDPARILQTGRTRTHGYEIGISGTVARGWRIAGGYAWQDAAIRSATTAALAGATVAQTPHHTFSLWNNYQVTPRLGAGIGILYRSDMYAAVDNSMTLPGYSRSDAALFYSLSTNLRLQLNVENVSNRTYYVNADGNNNISPGAPRTIRIGLTTTF